MTQEEKDLLIKDLCTRLSYGVIIKTILDNGKLIGFDIEREELHLMRLNDEIFNRYYTVLNDDPKPYLRPMSSMTDEEREELKQLSDEYLEEWTNTKTPIDKWKLDGKISYNRSVFYNSHHLDWNGLIEKGLALEAPEGMYSIK